MALFTRRAALMAAGGGGLMLSGCEKLVMGDKLTGDPAFQHVLAQAQAWTLASQRFLLGGGALAKEYTVADLSPHFKANGTLHPSGDEYARHVDAGFADWRLRIDGLVARPMSLSLDQVRRLPARSQTALRRCGETRAPPSLRWNGGRRAASSSCTGSGPWGATSLPPRSLR